MPEFSIKSLPEVFVSDTAISKPVSQAVARSQLRKLGSRLYTRNLEDDPERLVLRNWYYLIRILSRCADYRQDGAGELAGGGRFGISDFE